MMKIDKVYLFIIVIVIVIMTLYSYFHSRSIKLQMLEGTWVSSSGEKVRLQVGKLHDGKRSVIITKYENDNSINLMSETNSNIDNSEHTIIDEKYSAYTLMGTDDVSVKWSFPAAGQAAASGITSRDWIITIKTKGEMTITIPKCNTVYSVLTKHN